MKNALLVLSSLIFALIASVAFDRLVGLFKSEATQSEALMFPPNVTHNFRTTEFSYEVRTNSFGFRDREFARKKTAKTRILAIGDSFTFGYGVEIEQAWPKVLEARAKTEGYDLEIANLGRPAGSPRSYAAVAEQAIPLLKPDLVIVAVLQGDDLAQMADPPQAYGIVPFFRPENLPTAFPRLRRLTPWMFPNLLTLADQFLEPQIFSFWKTGASNLLANMTPAAKARFNALDQGVKDAFLNGQLNPALINLSTGRPDYFVSTMELDSPYTKRLILEMANQLTLIGNAARQNQAKVIVVSVPYGIYVSQSSFKTRQRLGFEVAPSMLTTKVGDEPIRRASEIAGLSFYEVTDEFREVSREQDLFFELDGHFNAAGHEHFATSLRPIVRKIISDQDTDPK